MAPQTPDDTAPDQSQDLSGDELFQLISKPIEDIISKRCDPEMDFESSWQRMRLRRADLYYRGYQYLTPNYNPASGSVEWSAAGTPNVDGGYGETEGMYDYNIDIVQSYGKKYTATLGVRPFWNAKAVPDDPQNEADRKAARQGDLCAAWMQSKWKAPIKNIELFYLQYTGGTVYNYNPYISDKELFGEMDEPNFTLKQVPDPSTGQMMDVPDSSSQTYPASGPACFMLTGDTVTAPFYCRDTSKIPYLLYEYEENQGILLQMFGQVLRQKMNANGDLGGTDSGVVHQQGKLTRQAEASLVGMYRQGTDNTWTFSRYWLTTPIYEFVDDDNIRAILYQKFPDGLKVSRVEGNVVKLENEALTSVWGAILPGPSKTIYNDPVCWGILGNQDIVNDLYNIKVAKEERGLPSAIADADLIDADDLNRRPYLPKEVISAKAGFGGSLREALVPLPTPNADDGSSSELLDRVDQNTQSYTGMLPVVYGGSGGQETARGQELELSQGLMQLGTPGAYASQGWADAYMRGCKLIAKYAAKGFAVPVPGDKYGTTSEMVDLDALRNGKFHFEPAPSMPMSFSEKVSSLKTIISENPDLAIQMGFNAPLAAAAVRDFLLPDMPEIKSPIENVRAKVIERIQLLLQQQPIPGVPDPMTGQPGPMQPSIPPEDFVDDPALHAELTREWLNDEPGRKAGSDPAHMAGYQNVVAYGLLCAQKATPPPPPPPPPAPPKVSVSLKGTDPIGVQIAEAAAGQTGMNVPGQGGMPTPPPPPKNAGPIGGPGGQGPATPGPQGGPPSPPPGPPPMPPPGGMPPPMPGMVQ